MAKLKFLPLQTELEVEPNTKILVAALKAKIPIRFGCGSCQCGTCAVEIKSGADNLYPMRIDERRLLTKIGLPEEGNIRLSCRARVMSGTTIVDLDFQDTYTPQIMELEDDDKD